MLRSRLARICVCVLVALRATLQVEDENLQDLWSERPVCVPIWVSPLVCRGRGGEKDEW